MKVDDLPSGLRWSIILSIFVHVGAGAAFIIATTGSAHSRHKTETVITTKLVKLGQERPKELLPRKSEPVSSGGKPIPAAADKPSAAKPLTGKDPTSEKRSLSDALNRLKKSSGDEPEGRADGVADGEVTSLAEALAGNRYATEIYKCVKANWTVEGISPEKTRGRTATLFTRVQADGTLFDMKVDHGSGLAAFDRGAEKALRRCGKASAPPKEILDRVRDDGIEFEFKP